jgi:HK97 gp10 family phage protein
MFIAMAKGSASLRGLNLATKALTMRLTPQGGAPDRVVVGILKGAHTDVDDGALEKSEAIAPYAAMMEFGTSKTPARPFLRQTFAKNKSEWARLAGILVEDYGIRDPRTLLDQIGDRMAQDVVAEIVAGDFAPDSPATIAAKERKGRPFPTAPLQDTRSMVKSIRHEVRKK